MRSVEVAPGLYQTSSLDANTIVKGGSTGVDFLKTLSDLSTALANNDGDAIRSSIGNINTAIDQINVGRTQAGMGVDAFQAAVSTADAAVSDETSRMGKLMDADIIDATTRLTSAQYALNATLTAAAKTMNMSLVDKLSN
jgi:flagellin-like hook-associated protein FlgL